MSSSSFRILSALLLESLLALLFESLPALLFESLLALLLGSLLALLESLLALPLESLLALLLGSLLALPLESLLALLLESLLALPLESLLALLLESLLALLLESLLALLLESLPILLSIESNTEFAGFSPDGASTAYAGIISKQTHNPAAKKNLATRFIYAASLRLFKKIVGMFNLLDKCLPTITLQHIFFGIYTNLSSIYSFQINTFQCFKPLPWST